MSDDFKLRKTIKEVVERLKDQTVLPPIFGDQVAELLKFTSLERSGSLLKVHLSVAALNNRVTQMYLGGTDDRVVADYLRTREDEGLKVPTLRNAWYTTCRTLMDVSKQCVSDIQNRQISQRVKDSNLQSGQADVMDLPMEIAKQAVEQIYRGVQLKNDIEYLLAGDILSALLTLFSQELPPVSQDYASGLKAFISEFIGSMVLYTLGVCPRGKYPNDSIDRRRKVLKDSPG